jgi:hypothetical protein
MSLRYSAAILLSMILLPGVASAAPAPDIVILTCPPAIAVIAYDADLPAGWHSYPPKPPSMAIYRSNEAGPGGMMLGLGGPPGETITCRYGDGHLFIQSRALQGMSCTAGQPDKNQFRCVGHSRAAP